MDPGKAHLAPPLERENSGPGVLLLSGNFGIKGWPSLDTAVLSLRAHVEFVAIYEFFVVSASPLWHVIHVLDIRIQATDFRPLILNTPEIERLDPSIHKEPYES